MKVAVCVISWKEPYIVEFVEHYKKIGFDNIIFCDNNAKEDDSQSIVLKPYIETGYVLYQDYRGQISMQMKSYEQMYRKYSSNFDWIAIFDMDEYLEIKASGCSTIQDVLSLPCYASGCDNVQVQWLMHGDNGHIHKTEGTLFERFGAHAIMNQKNNNHIKSIFKCYPGNTLRMLGNPHIGQIIGVPNYTAKDGNGNVSNFRSPFHEPYAYNNMILHHFYTMSTEEFFDKRLYYFSADAHREKTYQELISGYFFVNERTLEKEKFIEEYQKTHKK